MHDNPARSEMHYIAADLDSRTWVKDGFVRLEAYLACWHIFRKLYPSDPR